MIDLTKKALPNTVVVGGKVFSVYTDYRVWLSFEESIKNIKADETVPVKYLFKNECPRYCNLTELFAFSRPINELPRKTTSDSNAIPLDFKIDSELIYSAFLQCYGIDLIDVPELHWHKFLALLRGLTGTRLNEVMQYRLYKKDNRKDFDAYEELREAWSIEPPITEEQLAELDEFNKVFGG